MDHSAPSPSDKRMVQSVLPEALAQAGQAANQAAARARFNDYQSRRANQTLRRQQADLDLFAIFFDTLSLPAGDFFHDPLAWQPVTWGLVEAFVKWQVARGYAIPSINVRLSTVKTYARLAMQAGALSIETYSLIRTVQGYSLRESRRVNARRTVQRIGLKKAEAIRITPEQALALKTHPNQPQGRRDTLMMCLLLDHGLRVGEVAGLTISNLDLQEGLLRFFRSKVGKTQVHRLSSDTLRAANAYANFHDLPAPTPEMPDPPLLRESLKNEHLSEAGMSTRAITQRVRTLGDQIGLPGLSAHDCRHFWATSAARHGTDPFSLQQAGGWSSLAMPRRYIEDNDIANDGVNLE